MANVDSNDMHPKSLTMEAKIRKHLLRPLARRRQRDADRKVLINALRRLDHRAVGEDVLPRLLDVVDEQQKNGKTQVWTDPNSVRGAVAFARALYLARRVSTQEYVLFATMPVEHLHDSRCMDGRYDAELEPVLKAIEEVRQAYGLKEDEYWTISEAPEEYTRLSRQYNSILNRHFGETLREFGLEDLADLFEKTPKEFDRLRERGRRSVFHKEELIPALRDAVVRYEEDARRAASANAYSAAVTLLGAGVEGLLLLRCLRSKRKACKIGQELPRTQRPRPPEDPTRWTFENLIEVCLRAGWLPPISTAVAEYNSANLAHVLRLMRNHVHPGRYAREKPWIETDERDYKDAEAIYLVLLSRLGHIKALPEEGAPNTAPNTGMQGKATAADAPNTLYD